VRFSINVPLGNLTGGFQNIVAVAAISAALEKAGLDAANLTDHPAPDSAWLRANGHDALDPFTALAFVAATSTRLMLHTNILVLPYRNPFITAKSTATLQILSGGRLILGVGIGYQEVEFDALGVDFHRRGALMDESLIALDQAWRGGAVTVAGSTFSAVAVEPRPVPTPRPPIWIGGGSDRAIERAAVFGDGWSPFLATPTTSTVNTSAAIHSFDELGQKIARLHERRAELGKTSTFSIAVDLGGHRQPTTNSAEEAARFGELAEQLAAVGADWIFIKPPAPDLETFLRTVRWYGDVVLPRVRDVLDE
jgi:probable F420-dependent oxidoreductase